MATRHWLPSLWNDERRSEPLGQLHREIDRMIDEFLGSGRPATAGNGGIVMAPRMDMAETDDSIEITAELPGVDEKDLDVSVEGDVLTIKGEKKSESEEKKKDYHVVERSYGSFRRSIRLPGVVDPEKVKAAFEKGVLKVTLPKPQEAKQNRRRIEVKSAT
jgi:HSP20 family protein